MSSVKTGTTAKARIGQYVAAGNLVTLDGSQSVGANGGALTYEWSIVSKPLGSTATLNNPTAVNPTFTADLAGQYSFQLRVTDSSSNSSVDTVTVAVIASAASPSPMADAGASRNAVIGTPVNLDGSGSSAGNGDLLTYSWTCLTRPQGSVAQLSSASAVKPSFTPDVAGNYVFGLVVAVGAVQSVASTTTVIADSLSAITLSSSDTTLGLGQTEQLYATGSFATVGNQDISATATWTSSDTSVATVNSRGVVTAIGPGNATISAQMSGTASSITLTVGAAALSSLKVEKGPIMPPISKGQSLQLTATATYTDLTHLDVTQLATWSLKSTLSGTDCVKVSDAPGTKGLIQTTDKACYVSVLASYEGKQVTIYVTVK